MPKPRFSWAALAWLRNRIDRMLHSRRYERARRELKRIGIPRRIVVICQGNICRSPYLAAALARLLPESSISSAGFMTAGRPAPQEACTAASRRNLDLSFHRSSVLTKDTLRKADLVIVMDSEQRRHIRRALPATELMVIVAGDLDPNDSDPRAIRDPWGCSVEEFESCYERLERCAVSLAQAISTNT